MARESVIGKQTFERFTALQAEDPKRSRTEIFNQIAEETGARAGTVAANFYREARKHGGSTRPRGGSRATRVTTARAPRSAPAPAATKFPSADQVEQIAQRLTSSTQELVAAVRQIIEAYEKAQQALRV